MKEPTRQTVILHGGESRTVTFENVPLNAIIVEKYDSVTGEALAGATFQLRFLGGTSGTGGTIIGQKVTGQNGTAIWTGLTAGTYFWKKWIRRMDTALSSPLRRSTWPTAASSPWSP